MNRTIFCIRCLAFLLTFPMAETEGYAQAGKKDNTSSLPDENHPFWKYVYRDIVNLKYFYFVNVAFEGTASEILDQKELQEFVLLKFKNTFTGYERKPMPEPARIAYTDGNQREYDGIAFDQWGFLTINIWTVGKDYPVAYHIQISINRFKGEGKGYEEASLGYASASSLKDTRLLKDAIANLMEKAASKLMKLQGKL